MTPRNAFVLAALTVASRSGRAQAAEEPPDPRGFRQYPEPVPEPREPEARARVELGVDTGAARRPSRADRVHYGTGLAVGGHARVEPLSWLGVRLHARRESSLATVDPDAVGGPFEDLTMTRTVLGAAAEPTFVPVRGLDLWAGLGIGWGRTVASPLEPSDGDAPALPERAGVFVEVPLSLGARYAIVPNWVVVNASFAVSFPTSQSGSLFKTARAPDAAGKLITLEAFPELGTSWSALAGLGVLL